MAAFYFFKSKLSIRLSQN